MSSGPPSRFGKIHATSRWARALTAERALDRGEHGDVARGADRLRGTFTEPIYRATHADGLAVPVEIIPL
jgi:hypothetical protein